MPGTPPPRWIHALRMFVCIKYHKNDPCGGARNLCKWPFYNTVQCNSSKQSVGDIAIGPTP